MGLRRHDVAYSTNPSRPRPQPPHLPLLRDRRLVQSDCPQLPYPRRNGWRRSQALRESPQTLFRRVFNRNRAGSSFHVILLPPSNSNCLARPPLRRHSTKRLSEIIMPPLRNNRWELFAQGLADGKRQTDAYKDAGCLCSAWNRMFKPPPRPLPDTL